MKKSESTYFIVLDRYDNSAYTRKQLEDSLSCGDFETGKTVLECKVVKKYKIKTPALESQLVEVK